MQDKGFVDALADALGAQLFTVVGAVALLLLGWIVALVAAAAVHRLMSVAQVNRRLAPVFGSTFDAEIVVSRLVFWFVLLVALVAAFNSLDLQVMSAPFAAMIEDVVAYLPQLLAALVLALVGWLLALLVRTGLTRLLDRTTIDERLSAEAGMQPISDSIGHVGYWVVLLLFLPMVLGALGLEALLGPVQNLVDRLFGFLPDLVAAAVILVVGYYVAKIVRGIVTNLLVATRLQSLARSAGLGEATDLPRLVGMIVFFVIFVPALISALDALQVESVSGPARHMLTQFVAALPALVAAVLILGVTWYVARFVAGLVSGLLEGAGVDRLGERLGLQPALGTLGLSRLVGRLLLFFAMLLAVAEAANRLNFVQLSDLVGSFIVFGGDVLLGIVILLVGLWLANLLGSAIGRSEHQEAPWLGGLVRALIIGLVLAMGLRAMGIADSIVNLAFGLTLGAVAVAVALSFGLGGREAAGRLMEHWFSKLRRD
ncbi:MAG: mechanosensitive ion channel [Burkholderiaceae bacterium]|nr:mechanosensitive ion channel [Burkholderiaceae bacterium]